MMKSTSQRKGFKQEFTPISKGLGMADHLVMPASVVLSALHLTGRASCLGVC